MSPVTAEAPDPSVKRVMDAGTPIVTMDRKVNTGVTLHIGAGNKLIGEAAAHFIGKTLGGQSNVIEIQGTAGASATVDRHEVFRAVLAERYPGVKVIAAQVCNHTRQPALKFMEDMVQRFGPGEIQVVYVRNDEMALGGAVTALEAAGRLGEMIVVGIDGRESACEAIKKRQDGGDLHLPLRRAERRAVCVQDQPRGRRSRRRSCSRPSRSMPRTSTSSWGTGF